MRINGQRLRADFKELATIGAMSNGGINRQALSPEDLKTRAWFAGRLEEAGLLICDDDAGNLSGVLPAEDRAAKTLLVGSHLDSVPSGGRYNGTIGVLAGLECARTLREAGVKLPFHLEVMDFTDGEGCWQSLFGALAIAGKLETVHINDTQTDNGPFRAALSRAGMMPLDVFKAKRRPDTLRGYLELHIEQSYRLEQAHINIGVVTAIVGRSTYNLTFLGQAAHAGTTDMNTRHDALQGASAFIVRAHEFVRERFPEGTFNCGSLDTVPGKFNIIPAQANLTVECRHTDETILAEMEAALIELAQTCADSFRLTLQWQRTIHMPAASMAEPLISAIQASCTALGMSHMALSSYAGHEAQIMNTITPCGMIFIPSVGGISHNPQEYSRWGDVVNGANVLLQTILALAA